jgi:hypothetical protein
VKVFLMPQLSPEWWQVRRAVPTASNFDKIMTAEKRKYSSSATKYIASLIAEAVCQSPAYFTSQGKPVTAAMQAGQDNEPEARRFLEMELGIEIGQVGFCMTDDLRFGTSPDGVIGLKRGTEPAGEWQGVPFYDATVEGVVEIKCPNLETQVLTLLTGECPAESPQQTHGHLIVTGAKYAKFLSYAPLVDPFLRHVEPDGFTTDLRAALEVFGDKYVAAARQLIREPAPVGAAPTNDEERF